MTLLEVSTSTNYTTSNRRSFYLTRHASEAPFNAEVCLPLDYDDKNNCLGELSAEEVSFCDRFQMPSFSEGFSAITVRPYGTLREEHVEAWEKECMFRHRLTIEQAEAMNLPPWQTRCLPHVLLGIQLADTYSPENAKGCWSGWAALCAAYMEDYASARLVTWAGDPAMAQRRGDFSNEFKLQVGQFVDALQKLNLTK